jgi:ribosomal protein S18 acetylase RimI-like enzyme
MNKIEVREISESEFSQVCLLEQGPSGFHYQAAVFIRQAMTLWPGLFLVAEIEDQFAGYIVGSISCDIISSGWILRLKVAGSMQRKGVATQLMSRLEQCMKERGESQMFLSCSPLNEGALSLYHRAGYVVKGCQTGYFGPNEDRLILEKKI